MVTATSQNWAKIERKKRDHSGFGRNLPRAQSPREEKLRESRDSVLPLRKGDVLGEKLFSWGRIHAEMETDPEMSKTRGGFCTATEKKRNWAERVFSAT